jgi:hypothetical protein
MSEKVMTLGQQDVQQAEQRALQQTAIRMLARKCDIELISEVTKLSQDEIKRLARKKN